MLGVLAECKIIVFQSVVVVAAAAAVAVFTSNKPFGFVKDTRQTCCCCFDVCHYLFEIDVDLTTDFGVEYPVTGLTIAATI